MPMPSMRLRDFSRLMMVLYWLRALASFSVPYSLMRSLALGNAARASWNEVITQSQPVEPLPPSAFFQLIAVLVGSLTTSTAQALGYFWPASRIHSSISARCCVWVSPLLVSQLGNCAPHTSVWNLNLKPCCCAKL